MRYDIYVRLRDAMDEFVESEHPRDDDGKFTDKNGGSSSSKSDVKLLREYDEPLKRDKVLLLVNGKEKYVQKMFLGPDVAEKIGIKLSDKEISFFNYARELRLFPVGWSAVYGETPQEERERKKFLSDRDKQYLLEKEKKLVKERKIYKEHNIPRPKWDLEKAHEVENSVNWESIGNEREEKIFERKKSSKSKGKLSREDSFVAITDFILDTLKKSGYGVDKKYSNVSDSRYIYLYYPKNAEQHFAKIRISDHDDYYNTNNDTIHIFTGATSLISMLSDIDDQIPEYYKKYLDKQKN